MLHDQPSWYDYEIDPCSNNSHGKIVRLVGTNKRVLELGCATGYMSRALRDRGCQVTGIEIDSKMAERAAAVCERIIVGDVEQMDLDQELGDDGFDVVVAADVLEHLKNPWSVLLTLKKHLHSDGYVVASLPNVAHGSVRLALLGGRFRYSKLGLLDHTHLRFFTRETMLELFEGAGYVIGDIDRVELNVDATEVSYDSAIVPEGLAESLSKDRDALTYQFVIVAYPIPRPELKGLQQRMRELAEDRESARREITQLRAEYESLREAHESLRHYDDALGDRMRVQTDEIETVSRQRDVLQAQLLEVQDQLLRRDEEIQSFRNEKIELLRAGEVRLAELERDILRKDRHVAELQTALDRILYSPPGKLYRYLRSVVTLGRR